MTRIAQNELISRRDEGGRGVLMYAAGRREERNTEISRFQRSLE
jgi:hypothetical protein